MPVRSLCSYVLKWPDARQVIAGLRQWAEQVAAQRPELLRVGYFGSYARGDWGVGSDLDVVLVVSEAGDPFIRRAASWDLTALPVPCDLLVYTQAEWDRGVLSEKVRGELIWLWERFPESK